jgi:23S rRNA (pseudouridine1915-N3)-methyltransferase
MATDCVINGIGKISGHILDEVKRYSKMAGPLFKITLNYHKSKGNFKNTEQIQLAEADLLRKSIVTNSYKAVLSEEGKLMTSTEFSNWLNTVQVQHSSISFFVGGAHGVHDSLKSEADMLLSLSHLTFSHIHCLLILAEQIYRGSTIIRGHPYHK